MEKIDKQHIRIISKMLNGERFSSSQKSPRMTIKQYNELTDLGFKITAKRDRRSGTTVFFIKMQHIAHNKFMLAMYTEKNKQQQTLLSDK